ncbi:DNA-binding protein YbiB [Undibacterium sp. Ji67W]|uniref:DNA-binding protein YbiB n=1 Tax=Undibacterium sp. Ji67W TaxID=3413042 RepID=UPI003BF0B43C
MNTNTPFAAARLIKEIGRGKDGARSMSRDDACALYEAMLARRVSDLELGAILLSMRIKGESIDEIAGFLDAAKGFILPLTAPVDSAYAPVIIPSYNGARKKANLTPLLALLLARRGVPVLVHGVTQDAGRVTTAEIFSELRIQKCETVEQVSAQMAAQQPAFIAIESLSPAMSGLLNLRRILGVRNSTHTLVKLLQPFHSPALRLNSYTHPEYLHMLSKYFSTHPNHDQGDVFLMRGTEGETVASTGRAQRIDWFHDGASRTLLDTQENLAGGTPEAPESIGAQATANWISAVLAGRIAVPENIERQVGFCIDVARQIKMR